MESIINGLLSEATDSSSLKNAATFRRGDESESLETRVVELSKQRELVALSEIALS